MKKDIENLLSYFTSSSSTVAHTVTKGSHGPGSSTSVTQSNLTRASPTSNKASGGSHGSAMSSSLSSGSLLSTSNGSYDYVTFTYCVMFMIFMILMEILMEKVFVYSKALTTSGVQFSTSLFADWITLFQFFWCAVIAIIRLNFKVKITRNLKLLSYYLLLTTLIFGATGLATMSLNYVTYPTKVVFKSAKLVPAMLLNTLIMGMAIC